MPVQLPGVLIKAWLPDVGTAAERMNQETDSDQLTPITLRCSKVELEANSHNEADEIRIECTIDDAGIDPRFLRNAEIYCYMDDTPDGNLQPSGDNLRFVGIAVNVDRDLGEDKSGVSIRALDYTTMFLSTKGFPPNGVPLYTETLAEAWARICDHTGWFDLATKSIVSTVQRLRDRIEFHPPELASLVLGKAVPPRIAKGPLVANGGSKDAWAIWQQAVGSMGLISFIRGDRCIVTTATDYYSGDDPPRMIYGTNVHAIHESRDQQALSGKNVGILAFNPLTGTTLESYYPPREDITPKGRAKKKVGASALGPGVVLRAQDYEVFDIPWPCCDQATLDQFAQRVWEERSRQELLGTLKTTFIRVYTNSKYLDGSVNVLQPGNFNLLGLQAGDRIRVEIPLDDLSVIQAIPTIQGREVELMRRGYTQEMAGFMVRNLSDMQKVSPEFQVHSVRTSIESTGIDEVLFEIEIQFLNRIEVSGSAQPGTGTSTPQLSSDPGF